MSVASIVIPAHNEATLLAATLEGIASDPLAPELEVAVVANACTDATADVAKGFASRLPGLVVVETPVPGKTHALTLGDQAVSSFPRIYLDADIVLGSGALRGMVERLSVDTPVAGSPGIRFDLKGADRRVRAYYRIFKRLPYVTDGLVGLGVYGLSAAGRARFAEFPDLIADDLYIQRLFTASERIRTPGRFAVRAPRRWRDLVRVRTRVARGNAQLAATAAPDAGEGFEQSSGSSAKALLHLVRRQPALLPASGVYLVTTVLAKIRSRYTDDRSWGRDESSREADSAPPTPVEPPVLPHAAPRILIDGVPFNCQTEPEVVDTVFTALGEHRGGRIITPNIDIMQAALRSPELTELLQHADIVVPDGMPLVWASRLLRTPLPERVSGADLVWSLAHRATVEDRSIYLLGGRPGIAQRAGDAFMEANPSLRIVGYDSPPWGFEHSPEEFEQVISKLRAAQPDLVYLALGFPKQDIVAARLTAALPHTWFLGCGGALDMAAGEVQRAHHTLQRFGGEWLHRLMKEPRRLARRYLVHDAPYAARLLVSSTIAGVTGRAVQE